MLIAIHDAERDYLPKKTFPNYALMKIAGYHKSIGDSVEWWFPFKQYDKVYSSKVFDFTQENKYLPSDTIKGGTGYDIHVTLPPEIDNTPPDYSIYPNCDYALGFLTRGCPNKCRWCVVPKKEGNIYDYRHYKDIVRSDTNKLVIMDNNILASETGINQLYLLYDEGYKIDINQGLDVRLVTDDLIYLLSKIKWINYIRFSCDSDDQVLPLVQTAIKLRNKGYTKKIFVYLLVTNDLLSVEVRLQMLYKYEKNLRVYAQPEQNKSQGIIPTTAQKQFARYVWCENYKKELFHKWKY